MEERAYYEQGYQRLQALDEESRLMGEEKVEDPQDLELLD